MKDIGKLYILGDSYSTFEGYIPKEYHTWYRPDASREDTDVSDVSQTWWHQLLSRSASSLLLNDSYSGTLICNTETEGGYHGKKDSFISRFDEKINSSFFIGNEPDTMLIFGGTNDNWHDAPIGELKFENRNDEDLLKVLPAVCHLLHRAKTNLKNTRIVFIINTDLKEEITNGIISACEHYSVEYVKLNGIGKQSGHPNKLGMTQICEQLSEHLSK